MNSYTPLYQQLAETIRTEDQEEISYAILHLASLGKLSVNDIDGANIPLLITNHAQQNQEAQILLAGHHQAKSEKFQEDKPKLLDDFETGLKKRCAGDNVPRGIAFFLTRMTQLEDENIARLGLQMLIDLDFDDEDFLELARIALRDRRGFPEAMELTEKLEKIQRGYEAVNLEMEQDREEDNEALDMEMIENEVEELEEEDVEDLDSDDDDIFNNSFMSIGSDDSGFGGESDEILIEEEEAEMEEEEKFVAAMIEIFMAVFKESLSSGNHQEIQGAILLLEELNLPLSLNDYRKHEISRLIVHYAAHNDAALELLGAIEQH